MNEGTPVLVEVGNSTVKVAVLGLEGRMELRRYSSVEGAVATIGDRRQIVVDPHGLWDQGGRVRRIDHREFSRFIAGSYDVPVEIGLDRVLNLLGMEGDGIAVSCGTAMTVDAIAGGRPCFGAILAGLRTTAAALHERIPALPRIELDDPVGLPARSTKASVANGILLGGMLAVDGLARRVGELLFGGDPPGIVVTGGDAHVLASLWSGLASPGPIVDELLLFRGMARHVGLL